VLSVLSRMLEAHDVSVAQGARAALAQLEADNGRFDAVICDVLMPDMSGVDLYHEVARRYPALVGRIVFLSGGASTEFAREFLRSVENPCLKKPLQRKELLAAIDRLLGAAPER
jgi:DNA-binding response OmpR family regulator